MNDPFHGELENTRTLLSFENKMLVSLDAGKQVGTVHDILIDPGSMRIEAIVTSSGGFLRSNVTAIKAEDVELWGEDVILVKRSDAVRSKADLPGLENCLSGYDSIPGRDVISMEGDRLGRVEDLHITPDGRLVGFRIGRLKNSLAGLLKQERKDTHYLPIDTLHSFGKDVLVLDVQRVKDLIPEPPEEVTPAEPWVESEYIPATGEKEPDENDIE
jgi:uncharacterized protein YrrD